MIGPRLQQPVGNIAYLTGKRGNPLQVPKFGLGYALLLHYSGVMTFVQPAGAAAPALTGGGPWDLAQSTFLTVNGLSYDTQLSGYGQMVETILSTRAPISATAPIPGANAGTQAVTTNENWSWDTILQLATSERDSRTPVGLLNFQNQSVSAYLNTQWATPADILTLPNNTTATFVGGVEARLVAMEAPTTTAAYKAIAPWLAKLHTWEEQPATLQAGTSAPVIQLPVGQVYSRIAILLRYSGSPDLTNQSGLDNIDLNYGGFHQVDDSAASLQFAASSRYFGHLPGDVYLIDMSNNLPNEVLDARNIPQLNLKLNFATAPANTSVNLLLERYRDA